LCCIDFLQALNLHQMILQALNLHQMILLVLASSLLQMILLVLALRVKSSLLLQALSLLRILSMDLRWACHFLTGFRWA
jgi:hypothetical protein